MTNLTLETLSEAIASLSRAEKLALLLAAAQAVYLELPSHPLAAQVLYHAQVLNGKKVAK
jgi:hypothetical protein